MNGDTGGRKRETAFAFRTFAAPTSFSLSCQVFGIASETCGIGKCGKGDEGEREGGREGGEKEVSPFLTLTFCTSTLIVERAHMTSSILPKGFITLTQE